MLLALAVAASLHTIDVPKTFGAKVDKASAKSGVAVLLPKTIPSEFKKLYADESAAKGSYELDLGAVKHCFGATACGAAYFTAEKGAKPYGKHHISLAHGITGKYTPTQCGGSCSPPQVQWKEHGVAYSVQIKTSSAGTERSVNKRAANSAIRHGDRAH